MRWSTAGTISLDPTLGSLVKVCVCGGGGQFHETGRDWERCCCRRQAPALRARRPVGRVNTKS